MARQLTDLQRERKLYLQKLHRAEKNGFVLVEDISPKTAQEYKDIRTNIYEHLTYLTEETGELLEGSIGVQIRQEQIREKRREQIGKINEKRRVNKERKEQGLPPINDVKELPQPPEPEPAPTPVPQEPEPENIPVPESTPDDYDNDDYSWSDYDDTSYELTPEQVISDFFKEVTTGKGDVDVEQLQNVFDEVASQIGTAKMAMNIVLSDDSLRASVAGYFEYNELADFFVQKKAYKKARNKREKAQGFMGDVYAILLSGKRDY